MPCLLWHCRAETEELGELRTVRTGFRTACRANERLATARAGEPHPENLRITVRITAQPRSPQRETAAASVVVTLATAVGYGAEGGIRTPTPNKGN